MKRALYSLDDEEFMVLLERTDEVLRGRNIPYMFVGGVATQAHIANCLCKKNGTTLHNLAHSSEFRIQDHLRATDDADITLDTRKISDNPHDLKVHQEIMDALHDIEGDGGIYSSPTGNHLVSIKLERSGKRRPVFRLGLDKEADSPDSEVSLNLYYGPQDTNDRWPREMVEFEDKHYFEFFDTCKRISLPFSSGTNVNINVKGIEQLLATKIARGRPKDWSDLVLLYEHCRDACNPADLAEVERVLTARDKRYNVPNDILIGRFEKFKALIK